MRERVFLSGKFLPAVEAKVSALAPGFLYGWGLFETMRSYKNRIVYLDAHLERLKKSCELLHIKCPYSSAKLKEFIRRTVKINDFEDAHVRLNLWKSERGTDVLVSVKRYQPYSAQKYKTGFCVCISSFRQNENSILAQLKTTSYLLYRLAYAQAKEKGVDEALILNHRGYIAEATRSNLFLIKNKNLFTPSLECGCLNGITRRVIFDLARKNNIKTYTGKFTIEDLHTADEAFLTNSLMGIMPLTYLEKRSIAKGRAGRITKFFMQEYNLSLRNGT